MDFIVSNWDTIVLILTNIVAYVAKSPIKSKQ